MKSGIPPASHDPELICLVLHSPEPYWIATQVQGNRNPEFSVDSYNPTLNGGLEPMGQGPHNPGGPGSTFHRLGRTHERPSRRELR
jgi:hypothetical protein